MPMMAPIPNPDDDDDSSASGEASSSSTAADKDGDGDVDEPVLVVGVTLTVTLMVELGVTLMVELGDGGGGDDDGDDVGVDVGLGSGVLVTDGVRDADEMSRHRSLSSFAPHSPGRVPQSKHWARPVVLATVLAPHDTQAISPASAATCPASQGVHSVSTGPAEKVPGRQRSQVVALLLALPKPQAMQSGVPGTGA